MPSQTESGTRFAENESFPNEEDPLIAPSQASNADGPTADPRDELKEPSNAKLAVILGSVWIGVVFTALDSTVVATLLRPMTDEFSSLKTLSWLGSAYLMATAITQPFAGRLTDIFGRRQGAVVCNLTFAIGTLICGLAGKEWVLVVGRAIAGLGGGPLVAVSTFIGSDLIPVRKRGVASGLNNIAMGVGSALGGVYGGWINNVLGWRWAFLTQIPFLGAAALLCWLFIDIPKAKSERSAFERVDYLGLASFVAFMLLLLFGLNAGGNLVPWNHSLILSTLPAASACLLAFLFVEKRLAKEPMIPLYLLADRTVLGSCLVYLFTFMSAYGILFFMPLYLQITGLSLPATGARFIPQSVTTAIGALGAGLIVRATGNYTYLNYATQISMVLASALIVTLQQKSPEWCPFIYLALWGIGYGGMLIVTIVALLAAIDRSDQAVATSALFAFRGLGSTLGVAICSAIFQNRLRSHLVKHLTGPEDADRIVEQARNEFRPVLDLPPGMREIVEKGFMLAVKSSLLAVLGFSILSALCSLALVQHKLSDTLSRSSRAR